MAVIIRFHQLMVLVILSVDAATTPKVPEDTRFCDEGWSQMKDTGKCFRLIEGLYTNEEAQSECQRRYNAHLPVPTDPVTNAFMNNVWLGSESQDAYESFWIGIRKIGDCWIYPNETIVKYRNWRPDGEPDGCCNGVTCAAMNYRNREGQWDDVSCEIKRRVMCQKEAS